MQFEIKDRRSGKTLEIYDGEEYLVLHTFKERGLDDGIYKIFVDAEMANMIIGLMIKSKHLLANGSIHFTDGTEKSEVFFNCDRRWE